MILRPPRSTLTATLFPSTPLFRPHRRQPLPVRRRRHRSARRLRRVAHRVEIGQDRGAIAAARHRRFEPARQRFDRGEAIVARERSEEHTSELQSLMRISYAVFCLTKKKQNIKNQIRYMQV